MRQANPFIMDKKGRTPLIYAKTKITDPEWRENVVALLEDTMEINKGCWQRFVGAFRLEQPVHKIKRSWKTMIGFFATMFLCQFFIDSLIFPQMNWYGAPVLKSLISILFLLWLFLGPLVIILGPGLIKRDPSVSLIELLEEFDMREICPKCAVIVLPRSRHCNSCDRCIDRFDHHC